MLRFLALTTLLLVINAQKIHAQFISFGDPLANTQWTISAEAPPEVNLVPFPSRIVIAPQFKVEQLNVSRDKKEELIMNCLDSFLLEFRYWLQENHPSTQIELVNEVMPNGDSVSMLEFSKLHPADLYFGIDQFRPTVIKESVTVVETDNGKDRTAHYYMVADGTLRIFNKGRLIKELPFSASRLLEDRKVVSGLLAVGPSLVNNGALAMSVSKDAARNLSNRMIPGAASFTTRYYSMKEFKEINKMLDQQKYSEAMVASEALTQNGSSKIKGRAYYVCAMIYHKQGNFARAAEMAEKAKELVSVDPGVRYYNFLWKYTEANALHWQ